MGQSARCTAVAGGRRGVWRRSTIVGAFWSPFWLS
jgi:hypothetical protein